MRLRGVGYELRAGGVLCGQLLGHIQTLGDRARAAPYDSSDAAAGWDGGADAPRRVDFPASADVDGRLACGCPSYRGVITKLLPRRRLSQFGQQTVAAILQIAHSDRVQMGKFYFVQPA